MSSSWIGRPGSFREVYPNIKSLKLDGSQHGDLRSQHQEKLRYSESSIPAMISCANPRCQQGGYDIQAIIDGVVYSQESSYKETLHCNGHEGTPKGRRIGDPCMNYIKVNIEIEYKEESCT